MLRNYFKIMLRQLLKNKVFTLINLFGLATGMAVCLLLVLYIQNELGYDNFHEHGDHIYRLAMERKYPGRSAFRGSIPPGIGEAVKHEFPGVRALTHAVMLGTEGNRITIGEKKFDKEKMLLADSNFFRVFSGQFLQGDPYTAMARPNTAVLSESAATRFFGSPKKAMGKQLKLGFSKWTISAVCRDWPKKSHIPFNVLLSDAGDSAWQRKEYVYFGPLTYLLLDDNASAAALQAKLPGVVDKYVAPAVPPLFGETWQQFIAEGNGYNYFLQPLKDIHLTSALEDEFMPTGNGRNLVVLGCIAAFILLLAGVNFVNLSTALAVQRAREVGIRKTFGSRRIELIRQFLAESLLFSLFSLLLALIIGALFTPLLNRVSGQNLSFAWFMQPIRLLLILAVTIGIGLAAGLYPAFVLSSFDPMDVLKGRFKSSRSGIALRNGLVIFQFAVSVILIVCTIVVNRQMQFMLGDSLGFKQDHIIALDRLGPMWMNKVDYRQAFLDELTRIPGVDAISKCSNLPGDDEEGGGYTFVTFDGTTSRTDRMMQIDESYIGLLDLQLLQGRPFSKAMPTDSLALILNESAVRDFGLKNPIGARLICKEEGFNPGKGQSPYIFTVVGVIKDYHYQSLHKKIAPLIIANSNKFFWHTAAVRVKGDHFQSTVAAIEQTWRRIYATQADFHFAFLDQQLAALYAAEQTEQRIFTIFSTLAILIACVGLLGLATYSVRQRTKEISIRKVLGAMPGTIILILSKDFLALIGIAALIAFPLSWWAMHTWLQNFAYRVTISWWIFLLAAALAVLIAMLTISYQAIRAATSNPISSLRSE